MTPNVLDTREDDRLVELEKAIRKGQKEFIAVGLALAEIRDNKLYRGDFKTFAEYCERKWGWTKQHAYRLIAAAPVAESNTCVTNARAACELAKVEPERRREVLAAAGPTPTAKAIREAASKPAEPSEPSQEAETPEEAPSTPSASGDAPAPAANPQDGWTSALGISAEAAEKFWAIKLEELISEVRSATDSQKAAFRSFYNGPGMRMVQSLR